MGTYGKSSVTFLERGFFMKKKAKVKKTTKVKKPAAKKPAAKKPAAKKPAKKNPKRVAAAKKAWKTRRAKAKK